MSALLWIRTPSLASSRPTIATASTTVAALASTRRLVHSKSLYARGRSAINASRPLWRQLSQKNLKKKQKKQQHETSNPWTWPKSWWPSTSSSSSAASSPSDDEKLRRASESWPSWLPKPVAIRQWEMQQEAAKDQQPPGGPDKAQERTRTRSTSSPEEVEGVFIRKDDPRHSKYRQSQSHSSTRKDEREWPWWLPPRPNPAPHHPIKHLLGPLSRESWPAFFGRRGRIAIFVLTGIGAFYVCNLERVPYTGRLRFRLVSNEYAVKTTQEDVQRMLAQCRDAIVPADHEVSKRIASVVDLLLRAAADLHGLEFESVSPGDARQIDPYDKTYARESVRNTKWRVFLINAPEIKNALVFPGGQIFVFTGILPICHDAHGVATVLSHEIAHVLCSHVAEKISGNVIAFALARLVDLTLLVVGVGDFLTEWMFSLPHSRAQEQEADTLGLRLMSHACFDPRAAPLVWQRMTEQKEEKDDWWLQSFSTHPLSKERMEHLQALIPAALKIRDQNKECPTLEEMESFAKAAKAKAASTKEASMEA